MTPLFARLLILIGIFASVFLVSQIVIGFMVNRRAEQRAVNKRLSLLRSGRDTDEVLSILRRGTPPRLPEGAGPLGRAYFRFQQSVVMAGITLGPKTAVLYMGFGAVGVGLLLLFLVWHSPIPVTAGVIELILGLAIAIAVGVPLLVISRMAEKRRTRMERQFPLALEIFTRALRAGHPIASALDLVTKEVEDPLGSEFGMVSDEVSYGAELNDALLDLAERWDLDDIRMFVISLSVQSETGGNLAEVLENLNKVIRDRESLYMKVRALSSEGRMSGWMLTVLPILTFVGVFLLSPRFYLNVAGDPMFTYGFTGLIVLYFIGVYIIRRIIDLEV
ncbi:type II secretion system F family protein [Novosphingobium album (ex Hu et al. 2023)]|uniref:Type II secretion system F family protein n=1 Tax=Novosphingobium album (ex Hu et al. 2023) TaxID=2930093 RepID=A0ABT0B1A5_9SPHN|nr:type II secretion system F family protein [Novosphingobium album (ex Hu et al. 2023)]MCJ2178708.1 type II secretion system F family protein [Novosphingobium album (ex Hu et al. 2023)]